MPGISIVKSLVSLTESELQALEDYHNHLKEVLPHITSQSILRSPNILINLTSHHSNPLTFNRSGQWLIVWEGIEHVNTDILEDSFNELFRSSLTDTDLINWRTKLFCTLTSAFLMVAYNVENGDIVFCNDDLARLPVYIYHQKGTLLISREYSLIRRLTPLLEPDKLLSALYLIFGYAPGHGSPYREIDTLKCSTVGYYRSATDQLTLSTAAIPRMPSTRYTDSKKDVLKELKTSFIRAAEKSINRREGILALSGGYDSRAVAAVLISTKLDFTGVTYQDSDNTAGNDVSVAAGLGNHLGIKHTKLILSTENESQYNALFTIKHGLNYLGVAFLITFLEELRTKYGENFVLLTGDGGDKVLPSLLPEIIHLTSHNILNYIYSRNSIFSKESASIVIGVTPESIDDYLIKLLRSYPVSDWDDKYRYFLLAERGGRWLFEGEDRNRYYCAYETPFYDLDFYRKALSVPYAWKTNRFYRAFLNELLPSSGDIAFTGEKMAPNKSGYELLQAGLGILKSSSLLRKLRQSRMKPNNSYSSRGFILNHLQILRKTIPSSKVCQDIASGLSSVGLDDLNRLQLGNLYTVHSIIAEQF